MTGLQPITEELLRLERLLPCLSERSMRRAVVVERVQPLSAPELVMFITALLRRVATGFSGARAILQELAAEPHVFRQMPYERIQEAYALAAEQGPPEVAQFFLGAEACSNPTMDEAFVGNEHLDMPLGTRRSAARTTDRNTLDRLLHDRDHRVIAILLENPRLVERDVIKIVAMRPTRPEILEVIARHRRWSSRYAVRKALACNPYTPAPITRRLLPVLLRQDVRFALEAGVLPRELRAQARAQVARI